MQRIALMTIGLLVAISAHSGVKDRCDSGATELDRAVIVAQCYPFASCAL